MSQQAKPDDVGKVNVAVCGLFLYQHFIGAISRRGRLQQFFYSHKLTTTAQALDLPSEVALNLFTKEYLVHGWGKLVGNRFDDFVFPYFSDLWQFQALGKWKPSELFHVVLHGDALRLMERAKNEGAKILGHPIMIHPQTMHALALIESERFGFSPPVYDVPRNRNRIEEFSYPDFYLAHSTFIKETLLANGIPSDRVLVVPLSVDVRRFYPLVHNDERSDGNKFRVICVASVQWHKGQLDLLEAWKRLKLPNSELVLIGRISAAVQHKLEPYRDLFTHFPHVPNSSLRAYYVNSDVFVLPSIHDGFGAVVVEAMASGLPVIVTSNVGAKDLVEEAKNGFIVDIRSPEEIASKLEFLYQNRDLARQMGLAAADHVQKKSLSWADVGNSIATYHDRILKEGDQYGEDKGLMIGRT